jgi:hypothetical protein
MTRKGTTKPLPAVGIILHAHGTLRLLRDSNGRMVAEVIGFQTDEGHRFLEELGQLEDIGAEICVCDDPKVYGWGDPSRRLHWRRA